MNVKMPFCKRSRISSEADLDTTKPVDTIQHLIKLQYDSLGPLS